jgi:hypothetical protein
MTVVYGKTYIDITKLDLGNMYCIFSSYALDY